MANHTLFDAKAVNITDHDTWHALSLAQLPDGIAIHEITLSELLHKDEKMDVILPLTDVLAPTGLLTEVLTLIEQRSSRIGVWCDTRIAEPQLDALLTATNDKDRTLLHALDLVVFYMPLFVDGRSFSQAKYLRLQGYRGEIRLAGAFGQDQIAYLLRAGVDSFSMHNDHISDSLAQAFSALPSAYSGDNVNALPMFKA